MSSERNEWGTTISEKKPEVEIVLDKLEKAFEELRVVTDELNSRLAAVLLPSRPASNLESGDVPQRSLMASRLNQMYFVLNLRIEQLNDIKSRLEI